MAVTAIDLNLEGDEQVYYSGQRVKGALVLQISVPIIIADRTIESFESRTGNWSPVRYLNREPRTANWQLMLPVKTSMINGIEVRFRGAAKAKWSETVQNGPHRTDIEHEKEEIYFDDRFCLWGRVNVLNRWDSRETLQRGRHTFPFQYRVPGGIPCSFEGPDAHVRYTVQGIIVRYDGEHITTRKILTVLREFDPRKEQPEKVNVPPEHPLEDHAERSISSVCCRPGRVSCSITLCKRAFVPGETIRADIHVQNTSIRKSGSVNLQLKQMLSYGGVHTRTLLLRDQKVCESLRPGQHRTWREYPLRLPSTCPSRLHICKVLDVKYCIALEATFPDAVLYAAVPIIIATVTENPSCPVKWTYKVCERPIVNDEDVTESFIHGLAKGEDIEFRPKYKYYEDIRDMRKDKETILRFRQSPGIKRRRDKTKVVTAYATLTSKSPTVKLLSDERTTYNSFA